METTISIYKKCREEYNYSHEQAVIAMQFMNKFIQYELTEAIDEYKHEADNQQQIDQLVTTMHMLKRLQNEVLNYIQQSVQSTIPVGRKAELFDRVVEWASFHDSDFIKCMINATGITENEAKELELM